jgi:ABC-type thiamin/hydroxymethylpyrimidine transport system permease subunit
MNLFLEPQSSYILSLLVATILMSFTVHLVRKAGSATLFYCIGALLAFSINDLGATGINKLIVLVIAGIIFELIFLIFKLEIKNIPTDIIMEMGRIWPVFMLISQKSSAVTADPSSIYAIYRIRYGSLLFCDYLTTVLHYLYI